MRVEDLVAFHVKGCPERAGVVTEHRAHPDTGRPQIRVRVLGHLMPGEQPARWLDGPELTRWWRKVRRRTPG